MIKAPVILTDTFHQHSSMRCAHRIGLTTIEVIASAAIIGLLLSTTATLCLRIQRVGKEAQMEHIALQELANALEQIQSQDSASDETAAEEASEKDRLKTPAKILAQWPDAFIQVSRTRDSLGERVTLRLYRSRSVGVKPLELSGWRRDPMKLDTSPTEAPVPTQVEEETPLSTPIGESS